MSGRHRAAARGTPPPTGHRRGLTVLELLVAAGALALIVGILVQVLTGTARSQRPTDRQLQFEAAARDFRSRLTHDLRSIKSLTVAPDRLTMQRIVALNPAGHEVTESVIYMVSTYGILESRGGAAPVPVMTIPSPDATGDRLDGRFELSAWAADDRLQTAVVGARLRLIGGSDHRDPDLIATVSVAVSGREIATAATLTGAPGCTSLPTDESTAEATRERPAAPGAGR